MTLLCPFRFFLRKNIATWVLFFLLLQLNTSTDGTKMLSEEVLFCRSPTKLSSMTTNAKCHMSELRSKGVRHITKFSREMNEPLVIHSRLLLLLWKLLSYCLLSFLGCLGYFEWGYLFYSPLKSFNTIEVDDRICRHATLVERAAVTSETLFSCGGPSSESLRWEKRMMNTRN